jgi:hypothetical protein
MYLSTTRHRGIARKVTVALAIGIMLAGIASSEDFQLGGATAWPEAEFHMARMIYETRSCAGSRGQCNPWWAVDYPEAEWNFLPALRRMTAMSVADDTVHLRLTDDRIFDHPWLLVQQPARGYWRPTFEDVARLREYLHRGGFLVVDDFHGEREWEMVRGIIRGVIPDRPIVDIPADDPLMNIVYELRLDMEVPGARHVRGGQVRLQGPPNWRGVYDEHGRLMIAINHNTDMGDSWEHADDPFYPAEMTALGYRFGVNYVIYAMTR